MAIPEINAIVAVSNNLVIGAENKIPWHISEDLKFFKKITDGHPIIMGWNTWASLKKPLPNRTHFVVSRNHQDDPTEGIKICRSILAAISKASMIDEKIFIIGGSSVYDQTLGIVDRLYMTRVDTWVKNGDAFFPSDWGRHFDHTSVECTTIPDPVYNCDLLVYKRKRN